MADLGIQRDKTHFQWLLQNAKNTAKPGKNAWQQNYEAAATPNWRTEITINKYKFQAQT